MSKSESTERVLPRSLASMQVDVTTRLGALSPASPTGLPILDRMLGGGLRTGMALSVTGASGVGKTALSLTFAYMAARSRAAVVLASATLDETEVVARLSARALHREEPDSTTSYGEIWSGEAWQAGPSRNIVSLAVDTVSKKVGSHLHLHRSDPFESTQVLRRVAGQLWDRHERVVVVVDGVEAFSAHCGGDATRARVANGDLAGRVSIVAYELRRLAERGCVVVMTSASRHADLVAPAATMHAEMRAVEGTAVRISDRALALGTRPVDLVIRKNVVGPTGIVPLRFIAGAATFEERAP
ncbi:MAG: ATPase domain-containing protein [Polyangiaceae bacterium]